MEENILYTPSNILSGIDLSLSVETTPINEYIEEGLKFKEFYFPGREVCGKRAKAYAMLCHLNDIEKSPLLVIMGNSRQSIDKELMSFYAMRGFTVFMFDYLGESERAKYTFYPKEIEYANYIKAGRRLTFVDTNARETSSFEWLTLLSYAVSCGLSLPETQGDKALLLGIGLGANIVWMLSALDKRIAASCTIFSAGWYEYQGIYKYSEDNSLKEINEERERWIAGLAVQAYSKNITSPMLYMSCTNNKMTDIDRAFDTISRMQENPNVMSYFAPRLSTLIGQKGAENSVLFFKKYCKGSEAEVPKSLISIEKENGKLALRLTVKSDTAVSYRIFYCEGQVNPSARNWLEVRDNPKISDEITVYPEIRFGNKLIFAIANVQYKNGLILSTNLSVKDLSKLELEPLPIVRRNPVIYNASMGKDTFTAFLPKNPTFKEILLSDYTIKLKTGPGNINGVTVNGGGLATYKVGDSIYKGEDEESFKFDVYSAEPQEIAIYFLDKAGCSDEHYHIYKITLLGGEMWQPVEIKKQNLKTADGQSLKSWKDVSKVGFYADKEFLINNILWI